jgi:chemotaxis methyl-accepting protein methylase
MSHTILASKLAAAGREVWSQLPPPVLESVPVRDVGHLIHNLARKFGDRTQSTATYFLRNVPLLESVTEQLSELHPEGSLRLGIIGCSTGAEVYSLLWMIRSRFPSLTIVPVAMDISPEVVNVARAGRYKLGTPELRKPLPEETMQQIFDRQGDDLTVKSWISEGIRWIVADARDQELMRKLGTQDVVLANNFLVHMMVPEATQCLTNLFRLLRPGGLFVCRGVDLHVRESVLKNSGLKPVTARIEEIHGADPTIDAPKDWPWKYWGLEPLDKGRKNWQFRYASIFREPHADQIEELQGFGQPPFNSIKATLHA